MFFFAKRKKKNVGGSSKGGVQQCRRAAREAEVRAQAAKMHLSSLTALPGAYSCMLLSRLHVVFLETLLRVCASHG